VLQEKHGVLKVHELQFRCKFEEKGCTDVAVELREAVFFRKIGIVEPHYLVDVKFSGKLAGHPPIREIHEGDIHFFKVLKDLSVNLLDHGLHLI